MANQQNRNEDFILLHLLAKEVLDEKVQHQIWEDAIRGSPARLCRIRLDANNNSNYDGGCEIGVDC